MRFRLRRRGSRAYPQKLDSELEIATVTGEHGRDITIENVGVLTNREVGR